MKTVLFLLAGLLLVIQSQAEAQNPPRKEGICPTGFYTSGKYCIPIKDAVQPRLPRAGQCPLGYHTSGKYCVMTGKDSPPVVVKNGTCPSGYYPLGSSCRKQKQ